MRSSAGSIERLKDGRYKITVTIGYNPRTENPRAEGSSPPPTTSSEPIFREIQNSKKC